MAEEEKREGQKYWKVGGGGRGGDSEAGAKPLKGIEGQGIITDREMKG